MDSLLPSDPTSIDGYVIEGRLGSGGFGIVYAATGPDGVEVAIKVLRPELSDDLRLRDRLAREAEALGRVEGERTAEIFKVVTEGDLVYLVMERVEGESLNDQVNENGALSGPMLWFAGTGLVQALQEIHAAGIVHRDLKPSNVMYGPDGVKVLDFGISIVADETALTQTGAFVGTGAWMAPEMVLGNDITEKTDVYALGLVLAFIALGRHPFGEGRADALMYRIANTDPDLEGIPEPFIDAVSMCLHRDPDDRPGLEELAKFFGSNGEQQISATSIVGSDTGGTRIVQPAVAAASGGGNKKRNMLIGASIVAAAAVVGIIVGVTGGGEGSDELAGSGDTELQTRNAALIDNEETEEPVIEEELVEEATEEVAEEEPVEEEEPVAAIGCSISAVSNSPGNIVLQVDFTNGQPTQFWWRLIADDGVDAVVAREATRDPNNSTLAISQFLDDGNYSTGTYLVDVDTRGVATPTSDGDQPTICQFSADIESALTPTPTSVPTPTPTPSPVFQSTCSIADRDLDDPRYFNDYSPPSSVGTVTVNPPLEGATYMPPFTGETSRVVEIDGVVVQSDGPFTLYEPSEGSFLTAEGPPAMAPEPGETVNFTDNVTVTIEWDTPNSGQLIETVTCSNTTTYTRPQPMTDPFTGCEVLITGFENNNYTDGQTNTWSFDFRVRFPFADGLVEGDVSFEWVTTGFGDGPYVNYVTSPGGSMQGEQILTLNVVSSSWSGGEEFVGTAQGQFESVAISGDAVQVGVSGGDFQYEWGNGNISNGNCQSGAIVYTIP